MDKILQTLKWRRINHVDELLTFKESELGKIMAPIFLGLNYPLCSPVWYLPLGRIDFKGKIHDLKLKLISDKKQAKYYYPPF